MNFNDIGLSNSTVEAADKLDVKEATSFQQAILAERVKGKSIIANHGEADNEEVQTAYAIAAHEALQQSGGEKGPHVIILTPTSGQAHSICDYLNTLGLDEEHCICADDDGTIDEQASSISNAPDVIVGNPKRFQTLLKEKRYIFREVDLLILDGLDAMLEDGHRDLLKRIKRRLLSDYQSIISAATYDKEVKTVAEKFAAEPAILGFDGAGGNASDAPPEIDGQLTQSYINVPPRMKISTLTAHLDQSPDDRCVIFTASKRGTDRLYKVLKKRHKKATSLHAKLSDQKRAQRFSNFTNSDVQYLLVADISAAELEINSVQQIINYDVPNSADEYLYRAGLAAADGSASIVSLVSKQDRSDISELQNELGQTPDELPLPDEVKKKLKQRKKNKSNGRNKKKKKRSRSKSKSKSKKGDELQLPQPSYEKLSGGRSGNHDKKKTGVVKFFKKLFS